MRKRNVSILSVTVLTAVVLFYFQNCAPAGQLASDSDPLNPEVRIVDEWNKSQIQFAQDSVQVHDEALQVAVGGLCNREHNNEKISWALWGDEASAPLLLGGSLCKSGQFAFNILDLGTVVCGIPYRLVVEGEWGAVARATFEKRCQPLASEIIAAPESSPVGTECTVEYVPAGASTCSQVCYRASQVVLNVAVDPRRCAGLAQKLASP